MALRSTGSSSRGRWCGGLDEGGGREKEREEGGKVKVYSPSCTTEHTHTLWCELNVRCHQAQSPEDRQTQR